MAASVVHIIRRWPILPLLIIVLLIIAAIFAPLIAPENPRTINLRAIIPEIAPPIWNTAYYAENQIVRQDDPTKPQRFILGADHAGRDVLSRVIFGARISLAVAAISAVTGIIVGTIVGLVAGYYGGFFDEIILRIVDVWNALPFLLLAILFSVTIGPSVVLVMGLLALVAWAGGVRNVRAEVLYLKEQDYVSQARVSGATGLRIMYRHLLPGVVNTVVVVATLRVGALILTEASLSFLGAGIPPQTPTWGNMISESRQYLSDAWWIAVFPGLAILLVVMSVNFLGDWLRDRLDPRLRQL